MSTTNPEFCIDFFVYFFYEEEVFDSDKKRSFYKKKAKLQPFKKKSWLKSVDSEFKIGYLHVMEVLSLSHL